jgi:hypothetical protein
MLAAADVRPHVNDAGKSPAHSAAIAANKGHRHLLKVALRAHLCEIESLPRRSIPKAHKRSKGGLQTQGRPLGRPSTYRHLSVCRPCQLLKSSLPSRAVVFDSPHLTARPTLLRQGSCISKRERVTPDSRNTRLEASHHECDRSHAPARVTQPVVS